MCHRPTNPNAPGKTAAAAGPEQTGSKSAHQEELALDIAHHRLQPRGVELPVLAQHLRQEAAQIRLAVEARLVRVRVRVRVWVRVRVRVSG